MSIKKHKTFFINLVKNAIKNQIYLKTNDAKYKLKYQPQISLELQAEILVDTFIDQEIYNNKINKTKMSKNHATNCKVTPCTCDEYHTFDDLYAHRISLYMALCRILSEEGAEIWRSKKHSDGSCYEGWFVLGINKIKGMQITYHLPMSKWQECNYFAETLKKAPKFDGHTSEEVIDRIDRIDKLY